MRRLPNRIFHEDIMCRKFTCEDSVKQSIINVYKYVSYEINFVSGSDVDSYALICLEIGRECIPYFCHFAKYSKLLNAGIKEYHVRKLQEKIKQRQYDWEPIHGELLFSPYHIGKFYTNMRLSNDWD